LAPKSERQIVSRPHDVNRIKHEQHDPEWYLADPRTRKWMVQCRTCLRYGYRHDAPAEFFDRALLNQHFEALELDDGGRCQHCQELPSECETQDAG
jgi:hypothetical protein